MEPIKHLILTHLRGEITPELQAELDSWLAADEGNSQLFTELNDPDQVALSLAKMDRLHEDEIWERLQQQGGREKGKQRRSWWLVAAVTFALLGTGAWLLFHNRSSEPSLLTQAQRFRNDVAPAKNSAVLTLAGGQQIILDSAGSGAIGQQGKTTIVNSSGQLAYNPANGASANPANGASAELLLNTLTTGKGNVYQLILPDRSKVWLNASSSITYPTAFSGSERKVTITGEAYFEIVRNEKQPFLVENGATSVQVLGTNFNVNTYGDEAAFATTLLVGSVRVVHGSRSSLLRPGQQAVLDKKQEQLNVVNDANLEEVMAWKNGLFKFNDATIGTIMRQIARWYDVEVVYDTSISQHFVGDIPRDVPLSELLKMLEMTDQVHFKVDGRNITVIR